MGLAVGVQGKRDALGWMGSVTPGWWQPHKVAAAHSPKSS